MAVSDEDIQLLRGQYDHAIARFNFESEQQVARNNFFMVFQGVVIAGFLSGLKDISSSSHILFSVFSLFFFVLSIIQSKNAAASVRMIFATGDRVKYLERKLISSVDGADYFVYEYTNVEAIMDNEIIKADDRSRQQSRPLHGIIEGVTLWYVSKNKYVARNNLYAAWVFCLFWLAVFIYLLCKQF